jgi:uncharacterized protein YdbL (DUF1318 family)
LRNYWFYLLFTTALGCSFNFELTSQKTALENQIMGSYQELEADAVLSSSVRAVDESGKSKKVEISQLQEEAVRARQDQEFNRDDLDELKEIGLIGEGSEGNVVPLSPEITDGKPGTKDQENLAKTLCEQENADRHIIWKRIIDSNENLSEKDLPEVRRTFAKMQRDSAQVGYWVQSDDGSWSKKK